MIVSQPKVYQTCSSNDKEKSKYVIWTSEMDSKLAKVLVEQVKKGNKVDNVFKPEALAAAVKALNEQFGLYLSKGHIKNRLKTWRKQFGVLKELLVQRGFEWNERQKMVVADDAVWNQYIKAHPDGRIFRAKSIENYDELCTILGNDKAVKSFSDDVIASFSDDATEIGVNFTVDEGDLDVSIVSEIQTDENQSKKMMKWTEEMDRWLARLLADQVRKGLKVDKALQSEAYEATVLALNAKLGLQLTKYHIKNRLKTWKKQYELITEILSHVGFKWDGTTKMITANDSTWNNYIRTHPDSWSFRARAFENYEHFCTIFGDFNKCGRWSDSTCYERVEAVNVYPVNCVDSVKDPVKNVRWTSEMDNCLSAALVKQIKLGNRSKLDYKLKPAAFEAAVLAINEKFQLYLGKIHIKNRLKTWKKQYDILKELLSHSGFEWDEKRMMVIASDTVWNEYIKINPDARILKGRVIRNYKEWCIIIGHSDPSDCSIIGPHATMSLAVDEETMEAPETNCHGVHNPKEKEQSVTWTDAMDHCLTELLVKQVMLGNKSEQNFKTSAYTAAQTVLNDRFGLNLSKENIKNQLQTWRKQYILVKEMISQWRFQWDEGQKMVVGSDSEWKEYIKKRNLGATVELSPCDLKPFSGPRVMWDALQWAAPSIFST
ncbi:hypothetical protein PIB30_033333 [Stylosanthes scabra]|uniref:Myb/SANT-like domain-containing protein n=1 Tax=Stylosanthes scabra TaxID=79078 RepID=A0ABU6VEG1_9FABA|nr:hypothetical protein [Stylosanthes scabra]